MEISNSKRINSLTPLKIDIEPENGWLEDEFPFGMVQIQGRTVSFREGSLI